MNLKKLKVKSKCSEQRIMDDFSEYIIFKIGLEMQNNENYLKQNQLVNYSNSLLYTYLSLYK